MGAFDDAAAGVIADIQRDYLDEAEASADKLCKIISERRAEQVGILLEWH